MLAAVTMLEIDSIFEVLDRLGISREAVVIPLKPAHPGHIRTLPNGKVEITVESEGPFAQWLADLEAELRQATSA